ncbi:transcriptional regulator, SarA/Rot family [Apilactobacillus xinyiensis]|uniref:transcriptional regulator, SarA/Rot family n=1 Tax=Apilactobacillus xinyiensis TaxID=2841032 RepID=UPI001C7E188B|nr:winged helix DNA-binding protein [Apilactobacillus xinyiensis]
MNQITELRKAVGQLLIQDSNDDCEKIWMQKHTDDIILQKVIIKMSTRDLHVLNAIYCGKQPIPVKNLPQQLNLSQPTVSRAIKKLADLEVLLRYKTTQNSKEVMVHLTDKGQKIAHLHVELEKHINRQATKLLSNYSKNDVDNVIDILQKIAKYL